MMLLCACLRQSWSLQRAVSGLSMMRSADRGPEAACCVHAATHEVLGPEIRIQYEGL
jgi:hypothetical protein